MLLVSYVHLHFGMLDMSVRPFVVIVGPDGSGKTSVLKLLKKKGYRTASWKNMTFFIAGTSIYSLLSGIVKPVRCLGNYVGQLSPTLRSCLHLIMWEILYQKMVVPKVQEGVVLDSYIYKVLAKESLYGVCPDWFFQAMEEFPSPDKIIILQGDFKSPSELSMFEDLDPNKVLERISYFVRKTHPTARVYDVKNEKGKLSQTVRVITEILEDK